MQVDQRYNNIDIDNDIASALPPAQWQKLDEKINSKVPSST